MTQISKKRNTALNFVYLVFMAVTVVNIVNIVMSYQTLQRMAGLFDETIAMHRRSEAKMLAHLAVHHGELNLYEVVPMGSKPNDPRQDGVYTIHEVEDTGLGDEEYYKTYNAQVREVVDDPKSLSWQIRLAVKAAKERGEWIEPKPAEIEEELPESNDPPPPRPSRPLTAEEAFGPAPVQKK